MPNPVLTRTSIANNLLITQNKAFGDKYGHQIISDGIQHSRFDHTMQGCRARNQVMLLRQQTIEKAKRRWEGQRLAFYLPILRAQRWWSCDPSRSRINAKNGYQCRDYQTSLDTNPFLSKPTPT